MGLFGGESTDMKRSMWTLADLKALELLLMNGEEMRRVLFDNRTNVRRL